jgi:hypothetical protein
MEMPEDSEVSQDRTSTATNERLAVVETEVKHIKDGVGVIRSSVHAINGEMQKFVIEESGCRRALETIVEQTKHLPVMAMKFQAFDEMKPKLNAVLDERQQRKGSGRTVVMMATMIMGTITMLGTLGAGVIWLLGKVVTVHP